MIAMYRRGIEGKARSGIPWLSDIPFLWWLFSTDGENAEDVRLVIAARARRVSHPADLVAESIRRRLAFQRRSARGEAFPTSDGPPYGVRVTTRQLEADADAIAAALALKGHQTVVHAWSLANERFFDVYIVSLDSMVDAAEIATALADDGWDADLVVLPTTRS